MRQFIKYICCTIVLNATSKISVNSMFEKGEKKDASLPTDDFGRPTFAPMGNPGDIKSDRIGNSPDAVNNAILTKGWLRVSNDDFSFTIPPNEKEEPTFKKDPLKLNGVNTSQEPLDMNDK